MQIEIPEKYIRISQADDRQLDRIENKLAALLEELADLKKQITREKKRGKQRRLRERLQQLEAEVRIVRMMEAQLNHSIYGGIKHDV